MLDYVIVEHKHACHIHKLCEKTCPHPYIVVENDFRAMIDMELGDAINSYNYNWMFMVM